MQSKTFDQNKFAERLMQLMSDNNDTIYSLAEFLHLSPSAISRYTSATMTPKILTIEAISAKYGVSPAWLMGADVDKYPETVKLSKQIPVMGTIAAGQPILARQNIESFEYVPEDANVDFCLRVKGDSMTGARILDGDVVFIRQQPDVETGEIAAVMIDGEATLKRVYKINGTVILRPENPNYQDQVYSKKDMKDVVILGKAIRFQSEVR
ncbi:LexA family protein [Desulfosporosinus nitroreducens]|uniref:LexA family protein n=1 Tax=Desulfosporosinus nitroreducens TaxID=2018668 RepID=UPI00207D165A|nr:XRE family transcriptional regulator [Desulfosporosinus nitroreducens]MCO1599876.1 helix-turn-helix domain-containing protein [Desulfosporosinus nitroreducens]